MTSTILPTRNTRWGFFGAIGHRAEANEAWPLAMNAIGRATGCPEAAIRDFLDSHHGRHFADEVANGLHRDLAFAIDAAVERWMGWTIGRRTSLETGIPAGLPYLTGFVIHIEIEAEIVD